MTRARTIYAALAAFAFTVACGDVPTEVEATPSSPVFAKVKNCDPPNPHPSCKPLGQTPEDPRVLVEFLPSTDPIFASLTPPNTPRIYGDGPDGSGLYDDAYSRLFVNGSGDAVMQPRGDRYIVMDYSICVFAAKPPCDVPNPPVRMGSWFMNVNDVHFIGAGDGPVEVPAQFNSSECAHGLKFSSDESVPGGQEVANVEVRWLQDNPRRWAVQTLWPHVAVCRPDEHGKKRTEGRRYFYLPFALKLEEVLPPSP